MPLWRGGQHPQGNEPWCTFGRYPSVSVPVPPIKAYWAATGLEFEIGRSRRSAPEFVTSGLLPALDSRCTAPAIDTVSWAECALISRMKEDPFARSFKGRT